MRQFIAIALFAFGVSLVLGCGDSTPTVNNVPTDKQKMKEQLPYPGPGGAGQKK